VYGGGSSELSCSLAVAEAANTTPGIEHFPIRAFADALEQIPYSLAENAGQEPNQTVNTIKSNQLKECNAYLGINCDEMEHNDMRKQNVFEPFIGKQQQYSLATQACTMILKIDDLIYPEMDP
jgi:T-complex protein 1 subunit epsilon